MALSHAAYASSNSLPIVCYWDSFITLTIMGKNFSYVVDFIIPQTFLLHLMPWYYYAHSFC